MRWTETVDIHQVKTIKAATTVFFGVGAIQKMNDIAVELSSKGLQNVLVVSSKNAYKTCGAWPVVEQALTEAGLNVSLYTGVTPNPTADQIDEATRQGLAFGAQAVLAIGGGSPIDTGKSVAILLRYPNHTARELYSQQFLPEQALPIIAINTTHGTGTEANQYAVTSFPENGFKPSIGFPFIYPMYAIDDPAMMVNLPQEQTLYTSIDTFNHVLEAATSVLANPLSIGLAKEAITLLAQYLPKVLANPADLQARYWLLYASMSAGIAIDNSAVHLTHALEHPLSGMKPELPHAKGLGILVPAMLETIYPACPTLLAELLEPVVPGLKGLATEATEAAIGLEHWLVSVGLTEKLLDEGFSEDKLEALTALLYETPSLEMLVGLAPIAATQETVRAIYQRSLTPLSLTAVMA